MNLPDPEIDWQLFSSAVSVLNDSLPLVWDPIKKKLEKWVDMKELDKAYGKGVPGTNYKL